MQKKQTVQMFWPILFMVGVHVNFEQLLSTSSIIYMIISMKIFLM